MINIKRAILAAALLALVATTGFLGTRAFFSDTETSAGNVFAAGSLDLEVGMNALDSDWPVVDPRNNNNQQLFAFGDLIPGDLTTGYFRLESSQDAWACIAADVTANYENTRLDQETAAGDTSAGTGPNAGELSQYMEVAIWESNTVTPDGVVGTAEKASLQVMSLADFANNDYYALQDSVTGNNPLMDGVEEQYEFAYCFGEFDNEDDVAANGGTLTCDGSSAGNDAQTDSVEATIHFYAEQMQNNDSFVCSSLNTTPTPTPTVVTLTQSGNTYFVVDDGANLGFNVGLSSADMPSVTGVTSVKVELLQGATVLVTNYVDTANPGSANVMNIVESGSDLSSPFRNVLSGSTSWNYGPAVDWEDANEPTKAVITIEHDGGTWVGELNGFTGDYNAIK